MTVSVFMERGISELRDNLQIIHSH